MVKHHILITGPPAAGKSTLAQQYAAQGYTIHEREQYDTDDRFVEAIRNLQLGHHVVIRCCPSPKALRYWRALTKADLTITVNPGRALVLERIRTRARPNWRAEHQAALDWYSNHTA